jgi:hypothetical protein
VQQQQQQEEAEPEPVLEHINFWKELEAKAQHPERQVRLLFNASTSVPV